MSNGRSLAQAFVCSIGAVIVAPAVIAAGSLSQNAPGYEVRLVQPGNAAFDAWLEQASPSLRASQGVQSANMQGSLVINDGEHGIVAFAVRWRITRQNGSVMESLQAVVSEPEGGGVLTGQRAAAGPGEHVFVVPGAYYKSLRQALAVTAGPSIAAPNETVSAVLDCVIFDDGTVVGPDTAQLFKRLLIERKGQLDEAAFVAQLLAKGKSDQAIRLALEGHIQRGRAVASESERDMYHAARGRHALRMAVVLENDGRDHLQEFTSRVAQERKRIDARTSTQ